jgi:hypothetical protein
MKSKCNNIKHITQKQPKPVGDTGAVSSPFCRAETGHQELRESSRGLREFAIALAIGCFIMFCCLVKPSWVVTALEIMSWFAGLVITPVSP